MTHWSKLVRAEAGTEAGTGSVLVVGIGGAVVALTALALPLYIGLAARHSIAGAADAAALAAANVASGLYSGYPCDRAEQVVSANGARLASCEVDGLVVTVAALGNVVGVPVTVVATAGPPSYATD